MNKKMTMEELKNYPLLFQKENMGSEHYSHIRTIDKIEEMMNMGWNPVAVKMQNSKKYNGFQPHVVLFENEELNSKYSSKEGFSFQSLMYNSYNRLKAYQMNFGAYRFVCGNGVVFGESLMEIMKIRHKGLTEESLSETIQTYVERIPVVMESIDSMKATKISEIDKRDFAGKAIEFRYPYIEETKNYPVSIEDMLTVRRPEDKEDTVWATYNVLQESLQKGGQSINVEGSRRKTRTRAIKDINRDILMNKALWDMAVHYCK